MKIVEFKFKSPLYQHSCLHRDRILRQPLRLSLWREDLSQERSQLHFGVLDNADLIAGLVIIPSSDQQAKLRQMWVIEHKQGQGIGRFLISGVEKQLVQRGVQTIHLAARVTSIGFYEKLGFKVTGHKFEEVGIPHQKMEKTIIIDHSYMAFI